MRLMLIDTNNGKQIDGGFRHTVFNYGHINSKPVLEVVHSCKFSDVMEESYHKDFIKDPIALLKSLED